MKTVAIFPDGVGIRNFVLGPFLRHAAEMGDVLALHRIPDAQLPEYQRGFNGEVTWRRCLPYRDRPLACFLRKSLGHAHLCLCNTQSMQAARRLPVKGSGRARARTHAARAFGYATASPSRIQKLIRWHERTAQRLPEVAQYRKLFEEVRPTVLFCSHQRPLEIIPPALAARSLGIPTATFIFSWDNITSKSRIAAPFDHYLVWSDHMRRELLQYYPEVAEQNVHVIGTPQFDLYADQSLLWSREEFCRRVGADPSRPLICYSAGDAGTTPDDPLHARALLEQIRGARIRGNPQVLLRPAPADYSSRFDEIRRQFPELIFCRPLWRATDPDDWSTTIPSAADGQLLANLTRHAEINVNVASTMTLDFAIRDRPVVNVAFDVTDPPRFGVPLKDYYYNFEHYRPVLELGAARLARSPEEMAEHVNAYLEHPELDRDGRRRLVELEVAGPLGRSSERIVRVLEEISA